MPAWVANLIAALAAIPVWGWIVIGIILLILALLAWRNYLASPTPTVIGPGGTVTFPAPPGGVMFPTAGYQIRVTPTPPSPLSRAGTSITITIITAGGTTVAGVPVRLAILPGGDAAQTSMMDFGPAPTGVGNLVGTTADAYTDPSGLLTFILKSSAQGDEDVLEVTGAAGGATTLVKVLTFPYATSPN